VETVFSIDTSSVKFGTGTTAELGYEIDRLGCSNVLVVTDPNIARLPVTDRVIQSLHKSKVKFDVFPDVEIEPTDISFMNAIEFAKNGNYDGFVGLGGGSSIDTAKVANLYSKYEAELLDYVNAPIGLGKPVPGPLSPLVAIPTTTGTGSETTGVAIFDYKPMGAKTGIAHKYIRPDIALVDPENIITLPKEVIACSGFDVLCHGIESFTALPFDKRVSPSSPKYRPAYQGSNPISDIWALAAIEIVGKNLVRAVNDPDDLIARGKMMLAATFAGVGFGNAGVHLPHGMSYPVSGNVSTYVPGGYPLNKVIIPHGLSVILNAPAVFRFTYESNPERHMKIVSLLNQFNEPISMDEPEESLSSCLIRIIQDTGMPNGLSGVGYTREDIPNLVEGTLPQHRVVKLSPIPVGSKELGKLFEDSMVLW